MTFINAILNVISQIASAPLRLMSSVSSLFRNLNLLAPLRNVWRSLSGIPRQFMGAFSPLLSRLGIKTGSQKYEKRNARDDLRDLFAKDSDKKSRKAVAQVARISQIHLVAPNEQRYILHIGSGAGRAASQLQLLVDGLRLDLNFAPSDPPDPRAPVLLTAVQGSTGIRINGAAPRFPAAVRQNDVIAINGQPHAVELFFFDRTPVVTRVDASYATSTGPFRESNQDAVAVAQHPKAYLFAVADGVGAGQDGDEVSKFAAKYLLTAFYRNAPYDLPWIDVLTTAFKHINAEVRTWARRAPNPAGTTLTAVVIKNWNAYIAHVGDSRVYLLRQHALQQVTQDHMQQQPVELATVQAANLAEPQPKRDVLTRAIGKIDGIEPQVLTLPLTPGDKLLLTSDGLTNTLRADEIIAALTGNTSYAAELLVRRAVELEAKDNITAVVVECLADAYVDDVWVAQESDRVFTRASRSGALKLRKPGEPVTEVGPSPAGCFMVLGLICIAAIAFWILTR